jgi:hypothetical protein
VLSLIVMVSLVVLSLRRLGSRFIQRKLWAVALLVSSAYASTSLR